MSDEDVELRVIREKAATAQKVLREWRLSDEQARSERTQPGRDKRSQATEDHRRRAEALRAEGLSAAAIGMRLAREDDRPDRPYDSGVVRRWLRGKRTD